MREEIISRKCGMVLDHSLFVEYTKFQRGEGCNRSLVNKILSYYHNDFLTNVGQYQHNGIDIPRNLKSGLVHSGLKYQTLPELAALTTYKIILTEGRTNYPYVNLNEGRFCPAISSFYAGDEERQTALDYLKNLCGSAKKSILLYDKYINTAHNVGELLREILPNKEVKVIFSFDKIDVNHRNELLKTHPKMSFKDIGNVPQHHDRYLIIDDSIEVVLTSGFEYLQNQRKEISLVIRTIKDLHGLGH